MENIMTKYFFFSATYVENVKINNTPTNLKTEVEGYISDAFFSSSEEMVAFLKGYYDSSIEVVEEEDIESHLTGEEVEALNGKGFKPSWMEGRTSLFEWVKETRPDGYVNSYFSGRQPEIKKFLNV